MLNILIGATLPTERGIAIASRVTLVIAALAVLAMIGCWHLL